MAFNCLIKIIAFTSKQNFAEFIDTNILAPSGMTFTKINAKESTYIYSSIVDLRKYVNALKFCNFLDCETIKLSYNPITNTNKNTNSAYSYCWQTNNRSNDEDKYIYLSSKINLETAHFVFFPERDLQIIWLSHNGKDETANVLKILASLQFIKI